MRGRNIRYGLLALAVVVALVACRPVGDGNLVDKLQGSWSASEQTQLLGRTLATSIVLSFTPDGFTMNADTAEGVTLVHRLRASGTFTVTQDAITLSCASATQSTDNSDGTFDSDTLVALTAAELEDLASDFPAGLGCTVTEASMSLRFPAAPDLVFAKAGL